MDWERKGGAADSFQLRFFSLVEEEFGDFEIRSEGIWRPLEMGSVKFGLCFPFWVAQFIFVGPLFLLSWGLLI